MELAPSTDWFSTTVSDIEALGKFFSDPNLEQNWNDENIKKVQLAFVHVYEQRNGNLKFMEALYPLVKDHNKFPIAVAKCYRSGSLDSTTLHYYLTHFIEDYRIGDLLSFYNFIKYYFPVKARQILKHTKIAEINDLYYDGSTSAVIFTHDEISEPLVFNDELSLSFFMLIMYELFANPQKNGERFWRTFFRLIFGCKTPRCGLPVLYHTFFETIPPKPDDWEKKASGTCTLKKTGIKSAKVSKKRKYGEIEKMTVDFLTSFEKDQMHCDDVPVTIAFNSLTNQFNNASSIASIEYWKTKYEAERLKNISLEDKFNKYAESREAEITELRSRFDEYTKQITIKFERTKRDYEIKEKELMKKQSSMRLLKRPDRQSHPTVVLFPRRPVISQKTTLKTANPCPTQVIPFMKIRKLNDSLSQTTSDLPTQPPPRSVVRENNLLRLNANERSTHFKNTLPPSISKSRENLIKSPNLSRYHLNDSSEIKVEVNSTFEKKNQTRINTIENSRTANTDSLKCDETILESPTSSHESTPLSTNILFEIRKELEKINPPISPAS
ncbi:Hypothetical protein SRAE_2000159200 [Strongyloides ratti]|uniref:Uncharacterized protein n=1 Tax=Strongyloides ratti TaxID=34506 RepID=A0A090LAV5_STRRB|nr:Hypothetical protein SRAE_2000159200 [Strongyloides ratti]CEF66926.1 Hypothetical protein SRAE_2000159200 [Strongyloides ratti]